MQESRKIWFIALVGMTAWRNADEERALTRSEWIQVAVLATTMIAAVWWFGRNTVTRDDMAAFEQEMRLEMQELRAHVDVQTQELRAHVDVQTQELRGARRRADAGASGADAGASRLYRQSPGRAPGRLRGTRARAPETELHGCPPRRGLTGCTQSVSTKTGSTVTPAAST